MADALATVPELPANPSEDATNDVRAAIDQLKGETPPVEKIADAPQVDAPAVDAPKQDARPRNAQGQFIKADGSIDPDQSPAKVPDADPSKANIAEPSKANEAPAGWSAEAKADWAKLTPAVQAAALKREAEINDGGARWSEEKKTLLSHFEPVREISTRHNVHPGETIKRLAAANEFLERDAPSAIKWLADAYKVDLSALATGQPAAKPSTPSQPQADPVVAELKSELLSVKQRLEAEDQRQVNGTLEAFATAKDATGQALRPHYEAVKVDMGNRILLAVKQERAMTLEQAYDEAVWANPTIRAQLIAAQTAPADAVTKERERADKARRAAISAHGAPNGNATVPKTFAPPETSYEDDVRASIGQLRGH